MTPQRAKELLPLVQGMAEGKTLQWTNDNGETWNDYYPESIISFSSPTDQYRIKPEKKWRPWKPEEVTLGVVIRKIGDKDNAAMITGRKNGRPLFGLITEDCGLKGYFDDYVNDPLKYEHSTDGGKTWQPCGVEE